MTSSSKMLQKKQPTSAARWDAGVLEGSWIPDGRSGCTWSYGSTRAPTPPSLRATSALTRGGEPGAAHASGNCWGEYSAKRGFTFFYSKCQSSRFLYSV